MMNPAPFQILKSLPKTNCKDCGMETCLALATHVYAYGPDALSRCPHISPDIVKTIAGFFGELQGAPRGTMISMWTEFRAKIAGMNFEKLRMMPDFLTAADGRGICFPVLGETICVTSEDISKEGRALTEHDKILVFYYISNAENLSGLYDFCDFRNFYAKLKVRDVAQEDFEVKVQRIGGDMIDRLRTALESLGGVPYAGFGDTYDLAMMIMIFPRVPVLILYRGRDDEFPAYCKFMFDRGCSVCFDAEGLEHLADYIVMRIEAVI